MPRVEQTGAGLNLIALQNQKDQLRKRKREEKAVERKATFKKERVAATGGAGGFDLLGGEKCGTGAGGFPPWKCFQWGCPDHIHRTGTGFLGTQWFCSAWRPTKGLLS